MACDIGSLAVPPTIFSGPQKPANVDYTVQFGAITMEFVKNEFFLFATYTNKSSGLRTEFREEYFSLKVTPAAEYYGPYVNAFPFAQFTSFAWVTPTTLHANMTSHQNLTMRVEFMFNNSRTNSAGVKFSFTVFSARRTTQCKKKKKKKKPNQTKQGGKIEVTKRSTKIKMATEIAKMKKQNRDKAPKKLWAQKQQKKKQNTQQETPSDCLPKILFLQTVATSGSQATTGYFRESSWSTLCFPFACRTRRWRVLLLFARQRRHIYQLAKAQWCCCTAVSTCVRNMIKHSGCADPVFLF